MPLYIGKNYGKESAFVQSIFRLKGNDEDALTYALGFLLAHDYEFCDKFVRRLKLAPRHPIGRDYFRSPSGSDRQRLWAPRHSH